MTMLDRFGILTILAAILLGPQASSSSAGQVVIRAAETQRVRAAETSADQRRISEKAAPLAQHDKLASVLGKEVRTRVEEDGGRIIDLLVDHRGRVQAAVIEFGGFLGIGTRKIAVEWSAVRFEGDGKQTAVTVDVTREQLRVAPEYKPNEPAVVRRASD